MTTTTEPRCAVCKALADSALLENGEAIWLCDTHFQTLNNL